MITKQAKRLSWTGWEPPCVDCHRHPREFPSIQSKASFGFVTLAPCGWPGRLSRQEVVSNINMRGKAAATSSVSKCHSYTKKKTQETKCSPFLQCRKFAVHLPTSRIVSFNFWQSCFRPEPIFPSYSVQMRSALAEASTAKSTNLKSTINHQLKFLCYVSLPIKNVRLPIKKSSFFLLIDLDHGVEDTAPKPRNPQDLRAWLWSNKLLAVITK